MRVCLSQAAFQSPCCIKHIQQHTRYKSCSIIDQTNLLAQPRSLSTSHIPYHLVDHRTHRAITSRSGTILASAKATIAAR